MRGRQGAPRWPAPSPACPVLSGAVSPGSFWCVLEGVAAGHTRGAWPCVLSPDTSMWVSVWEGAHSESLEFVGCVILQPHTWKRYFHVL